MHVRSKLHEKISIEHLSSGLQQAGETLTEKIYKGTLATGNTYIRIFTTGKSEAAKKAFRNQSRETISEVMYDVGYSDVEEGVREVFENYGYVTVRIQKRYNKEATV